MKKLVLLFGLLLPIYASATVITYEYNVEFSGAVAPEGPTPWATVTFDDGDTAGSVMLTLETVNLLSGEHVKNLYFNIDDYSSWTSIGPYSNAVLNRGENSQKADGVGGYFDFMFDFNNVLYQGDSFSTVINGTGITASSFAVSSYDNNGLYDYHVASHIGGVGQNNNNNDSGWVTAGGGGTGPNCGGPGQPPCETPEPQSLMLIGLGLIGMYAARRRVGADK